MSIFKWFTLWLCLCMQTLSAQEFLWEYSKDGFSVHMIISSIQVPIDSQLTAQFTLTYPANYTPDIKSFRNNFLRYTGLGIPPFALVKEEVKKISEATPGTMKMEIVFTLAPQAVGKYALMFQALPFANKTVEKEIVEIPLQLVEVAVTGAPAVFPWQALIEPPLNVTQNFPVDINQKNKYTYILADELTKQELARSVDILHKKALPWVPFFALLALAFAYFVVKMFPSPTRKHSESIAEREWKEALKELQTVTAMAQAKNQYQANFVKLDHALRHYFEGKYNIAAPTSTAQEFLQVASHSTDIDADMRSKLAQFLTAAEHVKYARHIPTDEEYAHVVALAQNIMESDQETKEFIT